MFKRSCETIPTRKSGSFFLTHRNKWSKPKLIAKSMADVSSSLKNDSHDVSISSIAVRSDKFKEKAAQFNKNLEQLCAERNIHFINHA